MDSRVGELEVTVRAAPRRWSDLRPQAVTFASRVLAKIDEILERRAPGRVVLLRRLDMRWRLDEVALALDSEVEAFASEIATSLESTIRGARSSPAVVDDLAVFDDEVAWRAAHLVAVVRRVAPAPWFFARLEEEGPPPGVLARPAHAPLARGVIEKLGRDRVLAEVLNGISLDALEALDAVLGGGAPRDGDAAVHEDDPPAERGAAPRVARAVARPGPAQRRRAIIARIMASVGAGADDRPAPPRRIGGRAAHASSEVDPRRDPEARAGETRAPGTSEAESQPRAAQRPAGDAEPSPADAEVWPVANAGLFYLLNPTLELNVGELLWKTCLDERPILASVAAAILGPQAAEDAAPEFFGGAPVPERLPVVARELQAEVAVGLLRTLVDALPRRGLAELPPIALTVGGARAGRVLIATPYGSSFVLFAHPAETAVEARDAIARFLSCWPASERPRASPVIAELDPKGRIAPELGLVAGVTLPAAASEDDLSGALVAQVAGAIAYLFAARTGAEGVLAPSALVAPHLAVPGRILIDEIRERMEVEIPMSRFDLAARLAGLDRDPGWVPWLRKHVRFVFAGGETL